MKFIKLLVLAILFARPLAAQTVTSFVVDIPTRPYSVGVLDDIVIPGFDPAIGTLTQVRVNLAMRGGCQYFLENCATSTDPASVWLAHYESPVRSGVRLYAPDGTPLFTQVFSHDWPTLNAVVGPDDGVLDFGGTSGVTSDAFSQAQTSNPYTTSRGLALSRFIGVGPRTFHVERLGGSIWSMGSGCATHRINANVGGRMVIFYTSTP